MLEITSTTSPYPRLFIRNVPATAWIEHKPVPHGGLDWQLWFERGDRLTHGKCQLRLEIESLLRSWLLRECKLPLYTLSYAELRLIAEGKSREARHIHVHGIDTLMHRTETAPIPYAF